MADKKCPITCSCHSRRPYMHSVPEGCGAHGCDLPGRLGAYDHTWCRRGTRCAAFDPTTKLPAAAAPYAPLCDDCIRALARDIGMLVYDWVDVAQLQAPALSQVWDTQPVGKSGPPMPLKGEPEALQAEILHVLTTWEAVLRDVDRLSPAERPGPIPAWATTLTRPAPEPRVRQGAAVQRAHQIIRPRLERLAALGPQQVFPTGAEDDPADLHGWQALLHLAHLHARARSMLGRTRRTFWLPGECWQEACAEKHRSAVKGGKNPTEWLWRSEPKDFKDPVFIFCVYCDESRSATEYDAYVRMMVWPKLHPSEVAA